MNALLERITSTLADAPGVAAIVLGGSRARGRAGPTSDYDIGLYYSAARPLDTQALRDTVRRIADAPNTITVTPVGEWGPCIVGGAWLTVEAQKVDLLYREIGAVRAVIEACRVGRITMDYQPGHPHGFCSAIWAGEVAYCKALSDPRHEIADLKSIALPYPAALRDALIHKFQWEISFSIENAELAAQRGEKTHVAGCIYRALACIAQVLFALNTRYLINEKGALQEAADLPTTIPNLSNQAANVWQHFGADAYTSALADLRNMDHELRTLTAQV